MSVEPVTRARARKMGPVVRPHVFLISVLAFAALYPYFSTTGSCGDPGCPHFSHVTIPTGAVVAAAVARPALTHRPRYRSASDRKPAEVYLTLEPDPPRPQPEMSRSAGPRKGSRSS